MTTKNTQGVTPDEMDFLRESNAIEGVYDDASLVHAIEAWVWLRKQEVMTPKVILHTHQILMRHQPLKVEYIGAFRRIPVWVGGKMGRPWQVIEQEILMQFCFETMRKSPPPDWKALHVKYEEIHPFVDGNGRTGRMFMNWTRVKRCNLPVLIIKESERQEYYQWFK